MANEVLRPLRPLGFSLLSLSFVLGCWAVYMRFFGFEALTGLYLVLAIAIVVAVSCGLFSLMAAPWAAAEVAWLIGRTLAGAVFTLAIASLVIMFVVERTSWPLEGFGLAAVLSFCALYLTMIYVGVGVDNRLPSTVGRALVSRYLEATAISAASLLGVGFWWFALAAVVCFLAAWRERFGL